MSDPRPAPGKSPEVTEFLLTRRSSPAALLSDPAPDEATLTRLLTAAARVPDHGKLEPWRFLVIEGAARARLAALAIERGNALGLPPEKAAKIAAGFAGSPLVVSIIYTPRPTDKVPAWEQWLSAGAACLSLVNAALAEGLGASWLTTAMAYDEEFTTTGLGLTPGEKVAGFVHLGQIKSRAPERPRPDINVITKWLRA